MGWIDNDWSRREVFGAAIVAGLAVLGWLLFGVDILSSDEDLSVDAVQACIEAAGDEGYVGDPQSVLSSGSGSDYEVALQFGATELRCSATLSGSSWQVAIQPG